MSTKFNDVLFKVTGYDFSNRRARRQLFEDASQLGIAVSLVVILWKFLITTTNCTNPVVVVVSGSMEPAYYRGDLLFVTNYEDEPVRVGDVIIFSVKHQKNRLVHRVIKMHQNGDGVKILTKGDNNVYDDSTGLYAAGQKWLKQKDVYGKVKGYLPYIGYITIVLTEYRPVIIVLVVYLLIHIANKKEEANTELDGNDDTAEDEIETCRCLIPNEHT